MHMLGRKEGQSEMSGQSTQTDQLQTVSEPDFSQPEEDDLPF